MATAWPVIRRLVAQEQGYWGGKVDGSQPGPANFTSVDAGGSLFVVYDINRPEPDQEWDGAYLCINPGGSGNAGLATIWRRIADQNGFINATGAMTLTAPLPSSAYAQTTMTYELFKNYKPEDWMNAANYAIRAAYPQRHRLIAFEVPEDPYTEYYDWGHLAASLSIADPLVAPTVTAIADPGGRTNTWAAGSYKFAYNIYNSAGETLVSPTTTLSLTAGQIPQFGAITVPEQASGVNYFVTEDPGGAVLSQFTVGSGVLPNASPDNIQQQLGVADPTTFLVPVIQFWGPPSRAARTNPIFNTSNLDVSSMSLKGMKRRLNPGQYPERYIDLNPGWWREAGGTTIKLEYRPGGQKTLRFECMAPVREITSELDSTEEPRELLVAGSLFYLWNQNLTTGSTQNVTAWVDEMKSAEARYKRARNLYAMPGPRKTIRRPNIAIIHWGGDSQGYLF